MKHFLAVIVIVLIVALAGTVLSQGKRGACLQDCRAQGDACAQKVYRDHALCTDDALTCDQIRTAELRRCASFYDACRYVCDFPRF